MIKNESTTKLFYNKYALRIVLKLRTSRALEGRNLQWMEAIFAKQASMLDKPGSSWGNNYRKIKQEELDSSKILYPVLLDHNTRDNCKLRAEHSSIAVFTKDFSLMQYIVDNFSQYVKSVSRPETMEIYDLLLKHPRSIIVSTVNIRYNVSTKNLRKVKPTFGDWVSGLKGAKVTSKTGHTYYLEVENSDTLLMIELCISGHVRRIQEYVTLEELRARP